MTQQAPTQQVLACAQCGKSFGQSDLVPIAGSWVCGACKPAFLSRVVAGGPAAASSLQYAGVGIRFGARFIDGLVFIVPFATNSTQPSASGSARQVRDSYRFRSQLPHRPLAFRWRRSNDSAATKTQVLENRKLLENGESRPDIAWLCIIIRRER